jgi:chromosome segregation ATPase
VDAEALTATRERLSSLEVACRREQARLEDVSGDLQRVTRQAQVLGETMAEERAEAQRVAQEKALLEVQAGRVPELELELELLRTQGGSREPPREMAEQIVQLQQLVQDQRRASEKAVARVDALNDTLGDREAEILLLNAQMEGLQKQATLILEEVRKALVGPTGDPATLRTLLGQVRGALERLL